MATPISEMVETIEDSFNAAIPCSIREQVKTIKQEELKFFDESGDVLNCSYFGAIYEDVDLNLAIADFAKEVAEIWNKYTVVARLAPPMRMELFNSVPMCKSRYVLLYYIYIREFPMGAFGFLDNSLVFDPSTGVPLTTRKI